MHRTLANAKSRFGLKELPLLPEGLTSDNPFEPIVVAVHGLGGDFYRTWRAEVPSDMLWLSQLLPHELPRAQVYSFGYDSSPTFSQSVTGIRDSATGLLNHLALVVEKVRQGVERAR